MNAVKSLRVLMVEDAKDDAFLEVRALENYGYNVTWERVETRAAMESAMAETEWDLIIADQRMPQFSGAAALEVLKASKRDIPFILVSGTVGEEAAVDAMRAGAQDFVMKDRLARLGPAVARELAEAANRAEQRELEAELRMEQQRFRALVEESAEVIVVVDRDATILYSSPSIQHVLGYAMEDFIGRNAFDFVHADEAPEVRRHFAAVLEADGETRQIELRCLHRDGGWRWMEVVASNLVRDPAIRGVVLNCRDATARRAAEESLKDREELYRDTFDEAPVGIAHAALDGRILRVNRQLCRMLGYSEAELLGMRTADVTLPEEAEIDAYAMARVAEGSLFSHGRETRFLRKDGTLVWTHRTISLRRDSAGRPQHFIGVIQDITERKAAEEALRESKERLQAILDHSPALIYMKRLDGTYLLANSLFEKKFGQGRSVIGRTAFDLFAPSAAEGRIERDRAVVSRGEPILSEETVDEQDGRHIYLSIRFPLRDAHGAIYGVGVVASDISERKEIEKQFLQAQKMEAFGQLAGGVAHDFNNILAVMLMQFSLMQLEPGLPPKTTSTLQELENLATRASNLTRQLLIFSRRHEMTTQTLDLNRAIESVCRMLKRFVGEHIAFEFKPAAAPTWVEADAGMVEQVVMNLCLNARDAMPRGGVLRVELRAEKFTGSPQAPTRPGNFACLSVSDTGCGMDEATKKRIFEPFFTTKPVGQGTGLGLATVYGIAQQHRGWVEVDSAPEQGSVFRVYFPLGRSAAPFVEPGTGLRVHGGKERVLLVEDEEPVRMTAAMCLRSVGYEVVEARDAVEALEIWEAQERKFDLLLSDVVMPRAVTGFQLAEQLLQSNDRLKVVLMTGYSPGASDWSKPITRQIARLTKPFSAGRLLEIVRATLDGKPLATETGV